MNVEQQTVQLYPGASENHNFIMINSHLISNSYLLVRQNNLTPKIRLITKM